MERIGALINTLKEQFEQNADAAQLLMTVQLIQAELSHQSSPSSRMLGTSKVAVVMPSTPNSITPLTEKNNASAAEKPAAQEPETHRVKEKVLVDQGSVSLVKKNGQLDMIFDPLTEIPTLSHQLQNRTTEESTAAEPESLNEKLKQGKTELLEVLKESPVKDLRKAIGINDRFVFINELFRGDEAMYERSIKTINSFSIYAEAEYWISRELKVKLGWDKEKESVQHFDQLVKRRFS
jgi:hypothetical protein